VFGSQSRLIGRHVLPASSVRKAPAAEMAMNILSGLLGSIRIVCRHIPPAPVTNGALCHGRGVRKALHVCPHRLCGI